MAKQPEQGPSAYHAEAAHLLGMLVGICSVWQDARVIAMYDVVNPVLGEQRFQKVWREIIRHSCRHQCWSPVACVLKSSCSFACR